MACILARGFEHGSIYDFDWISSTSFLAANSTYKRPGGYSAYSMYSNSGSIGRMYLPTAKSEFYFQEVIYLGTKAASVHHIKWKNGSTVLGSLYYDNTLGVWKLYTGDAATLVATGTSPLISGVWYIIELYIRIADAGEITLRVNGVEECTFSGDTKPGTAVDVDIIEFAGVSNFVYYLDDVVINDTTGPAPGNSWPSGAFVSKISPTGAGNYAQWTPSTGDNYACVDEIPPVATDYVGVNAVDQIDSYVMADLPAAAAIILGLEQALFVSKIGPSTPTTLKPLVRIASTDYPEASGIPVPSISTFPLRKCWSQNPNTSADWTPGNINDLELGFKSAA